MRRILCMLLTGPVFLVFMGAFQPGITTNWKGVITFCAAMSLNGCIAHWLALQWVPIPPWAMFGMEIPYMRWVAAAFGVCLLVLIEVCGAGRLFLTEEEFNLYAVRLISVTWRSAFIATVIVAAVADMLVDDRPLFPRR